MIVNCLILAQRYNKVMRLATFYQSTGTDFPSNRFLLPIISLAATEIGLIAHFSSYLIGYFRINY